MNIEEFRNIAARYRAERPKLTRLSRSDRPATATEIEEVERRLSTQLPDRFKAFLMEFGGGDFALEAIYSAIPDSDWYLPTKAEFARRLLPNNYLPISDDGTGGYYVFEVGDGLASEKIYYFDSDSGNIEPTGDEDVLSFIARYAFGVS